MGEPLEGAAWCPTPTALDRLRAAGVSRLPCAPRLEVLRISNARGTFADLHGLNPWGACLGDSLEALERAVKRPAPARASGRRPAWWLRQSLSASGQGRFLAEGWSDRAANWCQRALQQGPVHVLPAVDIQDEFSAHAFLYRQGRVVRGEPVVQEVRGAAWSAATRAQRPVPGMGSMLETVVERLLGLGYFGPLGVDGFRWKDSAGAVHVALATDVNARYTMSMGAAFDVVPWEGDE